MQNGKGDKRRRKTVSEDVWARNWERIFRREAKGDRKSVSEGKKHT
jgi:hypothetical protein